MNLDSERGKSRAELFSDIHTSQISLESKEREFYSDLVLDRKQDNLNFIVEKQHSLQTI